MAVRAFSFTLPATTNYYQLWSQLTPISGFLVANAITPDRCCQLIIASAGALTISDSNNANVAGVPLASGASMSLQSATNSIGLKDIYLKGSSVGVSGIIVFQ